MTTTAKPTRILLVETFSFDPRTHKRLGLDEAAGTNETWIRKLPDGRYHVRCVGQHCYLGEGVGLLKNRNGRRYLAKTTWGPHTLPESQFARRVESRRVTGQVEHPDTGRSSMAASAIVITKVEPPRPSDGRVFVEFETMRTPGGAIIDGFIESGVGFGISSRARGSVVKADDGVDEVQEDFEPETFDPVHDESCPGAEVAARIMRESLDRMVQEAGSIDEAIKRDRVVAASALRENMAPPTTPPAMAPATSAGDNSPAYPGPPPGGDWILGMRDDTGHYRSFRMGPGNYDVWMFNHNTQPTRVASGLRTQTDAQIAAETHLRTVVGEALMDSKDGKKKTQTEAFQTTGVQPFEGTAVSFRFDTAEEKKKATGALEKAGFHVAEKGDDTIEVQTQYSDTEVALGHLRRVLEGVDIPMTVPESVQRPVREDEFDGIDPTVGGAQMDDLDYLDVDYDDACDSPVASAPVSADQRRNRMGLDPDGAAPPSTKMPADLKAPKDSDDLRTRGRRDRMTDDDAPEDSDKLRSRRDRMADEEDDAPKDSDKLRRDHLDGEDEEPSDSDKLRRNRDRMRARISRGSFPMEAAADVTTDLVGDPVYGADADDEMADEPTDEYGGTDPEDLDLDVDFNESRERHVAKGNKVREDYETGDQRPNAIIKSSGASAATTDAGAPERKNTFVSTGGSDEEGDQGSGASRPAKTGGSELPDKGRGESEPAKAAKMAETVLQRALPDLKRAWQRNDGRAAHRIAGFVEKTVKVMTKALREGQTRKVRYLQNEVARFESENERLRALVEQMADVQRTEVLAYERKLALKEHPHLDKPELVVRLERCDSLKELEEEVKALLSIASKATVAESTKKPIVEAVQPPAAPAPKFKLTPDAPKAPVSAPGATSVPSTAVAESAMPNPNMDPAPMVAAEPLSETYEEPTVASRLVEHRRNRRNGGR